MYIKGKPKDWLTDWHDNMQLKPLERLDRYVIRIAVMTTVMTLQSANKGHVREVPNVHSLFIEHIM